MKKTSAGIGEKESIHSGETEENSESETVIEKDTESESELLTEESMSEETEAEKLDTKEQTTKESVTTEQTTAARTVIPEGCRYRINATSKMLYAGDYFPEEVGNMDYFWTEDYRFYAVNSNGCIIWKGDVSDKTKTSYGEIPEYICGYPVTYISFYNCTNIPNAVENMSGTFDGCEILETVPDIPDSVTSLSYTFRNCYKLK